MPLFLITSVCDEGVSASSFKVVEAESRLAITQHILDHPHDWEPFLHRTRLWWDLTYYPYKYGQPRGWTAADVLARIDATHVDGDSDYQLRIHEIGAIERIPGRPAFGDSEADSGKKSLAEAGKARESKS